MNELSHANLNLDRPPVLLVSQPSYYGWIHEKSLRSAWPSQAGPEGCPGHAKQVPKTTASEDDPLKELLYVVEYNVLGPVAFMDMAKHVKGWSDSPYLGQQSRAAKIQEIQMSPGRTVCDENISIPRDCTVPDVVAP